MRKIQRTSMLTVLAFGVGGIAVGVLVQLFRSSTGAAPIAPPVSLAATLMVIAAVLVILAVLLRRAVTHGRRVNPFHAVRVLAAARAGQYAGALFGGLGAGFLVQLLTRSVLPPVAMWVPSLLMLIGGLILMVCGIIAERLCRVPPSDLDDTYTDRDAEPDASPDFVAG